MRKHLLAQTEKPGAQNELITSQYNCLKNNWDLVECIDITAVVICIKVDMK